MNKLATFFGRFFNRLVRRAESPEEDSVTRQARLGDMIAQYTLAFIYETGRGDHRVTQKRRSGISKPQNRVTWEPSKNSKSSETSPENVVPFNLSPLPTTDVV